jgi:hypothetical protein
MLKQLLKNKLAAFGRTWNYDTSYMTEIVDKAGVGALQPMSALQRLSNYRRDVPLNVYYGAVLTAGRAADCGPCLQLGITMAERAGVAPELIRNVLREDLAALPEDVRLGVELAKGTIARDGSGEAARAEIVRRWGMRALVSIAYGLIAAQAYPTFKYAIGHGHACVRVRIAGDELPIGNAVHA